MNPAVPAGSPKSSITTSKAGTASGPPSGRQPSPAKPPAVPPTSALTAPVKLVAVSPVAPPSAPTPQSSEVPLALPVGHGNEFLAPAAEALSFESTPATIAPRAGKRYSKGRRPARGTWIYSVCGILFGVALAGGVWCLIWLYKNTDAAADPKGPSIKDTDKGNFEFATPAGPWRSNTNAALRLAVNFVLSRQAPSNNVALFYRDYVQRLPSEGEMLDQALVKLRKYFNALEWERKTASAANVAGVPVALHINFEGVDPEGVPVSGEVCVFGARGFGYWLFTWCPADQKQTAGFDWDKIRNAFSLGNKREGWRETEREMDTASIEGLPFEIRYVKGLWVFQGRAENWDPNARIVLLGNDPNETIHASKVAAFRILVLEKASGLKEAAQAARKYIVDRQKEEHYPDTKEEFIKDRAGKDVDGPAPIGSEQGYLSKFRVRNSESRERYMILGVIPFAESTIVLMCDCDFGRKDLWDSEFHTLLKGFQRKK